MKIFLAAAHGSDDSGAVGNGTTERDEVIKIVNAIPPLLEKIKPYGVEIVVVPHDLKLEGEVDFINRNSQTPGEDICLEVNLNANAGDPGTGTETWYGLQKLGDVMQKNMVDVLGLTDRGSKLGMGYYFNRVTKPASAILELGFINNAGDLIRVQRKGAESVAKGIAAYFGWSYSPTPTPPPPTIDWQKKYVDLLNRYAVLRGEIISKLVALDA